jgi:UDP-N-acetylmuramoyl-tripeptide--D-alanyl-D-alanine ligase
MIDTLYHIFLKHPIIVTDTRQLVPGCIFFALKGDNFNGNKFGLEALQNGASFAIIDEIEYKNDPRCILVKDVLETLQKLATYYRNTFDIPVIAITGSNGKTTTKELISSIMSSHYKSHSTKGNFNNHIGVPLTLLSMPSNTEVAIIEMGANHQGEINELCEIARPTHGLITNIGKAHLEGFGGIEGVKKGKSELYRYLNKNGGTLLINRDEAFLDELSGENHKKIYYRISEELALSDNDYQIKCLDDKEYLKVSFINDKGVVYTAQSNLIGTYNLNNLSTAISLSKYFKVPAEKIKNAIEEYTPNNNRSQIVIKDSNKIILDAYNANPTSMKAALQNLSKNTELKKVAILGDMFELGDECHLEHAKIVEFTNSLSIDKVVFVGKYFTNATLGTNCLVFENTNTLKEWFQNQKFNDTLILIKGSRGMKLETIL